MKLVTPKKIVDFIYKDYSLRIANLEFGTIIFFNKSLGRSLQYILGLCTMLDMLPSKTTQN